MITPKPNRERTINIYELPNGITITEKTVPNISEVSMFEVRVSTTSHIRLYPTFDMAMIGALALKYDGINTQADRLISRMLGIEGEFWT